MSVKIKITRLYRLMSFKLLKLWYRTTAVGPMPRIVGALAPYRWRIMRLSGALAAAVVVGLIFILSTGNVKAQTSTLTANDFINGTMQYGTTMLTNAGSTLSLQQGVVGSWDQSTIDGLQPRDNFDRGTMSLAYGPGNLVYELSNSESNCYFKSYDTELQQWNTLKSVPQGCGPGSNIVSDGSQYIFYFPGNSTGAFFRFDIAANSWKRLSDVSSQVADYSSAVYATLNNKPYIYLFRGSSSASLTRYDITNDQWSNMAPFPTGSNVNAGISATWDKGDTIYAASSQVGEFKKYSISTNTWTTIGTISMSGTVRLSLSYTSGAVIASKLRIDGGYERGMVSQYTVATNTWTDLQAPPVGATEYDWPPASVYDGSRYLYAEYGTEIYRDLVRYDTVSQTWNTASLFNTSADDTDWHQYPVYDGANTIYYAGGTGQGSTNRIYKYDLTTNTTTQVGSQISTQSGWRGVYKSGVIYYLPWSGQTTFQKYDTSTNTWTQLADIPRTTNWGLDIIDGGDGYLYANMGGTSSFYRYNIASDTWSALTSMPQTENSGGGLARVGTTIYALIGGGSGYLYKYNMSTNVWTQETTNYIPNGKIDHGGFMATDNSRYLYIGAGTRTDSQNRRLFRFDTTNETWQRLSDLPAATNVGASGFYSSANSKLYVAQSGFSSRLWNWSPSAANYVSTGTWYSKPLQYTQVQSWGSLQATIGGTGTATIYTRSSDNGAIWDGWQAVSGTTINSLPKKYLQLKIVLSGNGSTSPTVSNVSIQYNQETSAPTMPSQFGAYDKSGGANQLVSGQTYQYEHPYFAWNGADDGPNGSGVDGYYVYFGTDSNGDPATDGNYQTNPNYTVTSPMTAGNVYYLRIKVKDKLGNTSSAATFFSYRYWYISPPGSQVMTSDTDFNSGTNAHVSISNGAMQLKQQSSGSWGTGATDMLPATSYGSTETVIGDYLYVMRGSSTATMWRYDLINKVWQTMASAPGNFTLGSSMTYDGSRYIYAIPGGNTNNFYRYDTTNNAWSTSTQLPTGAQAGSDIEYIGNGKIAMFFTGAREFDIYDITSASFSQRTSYPSSVSYSGSGIWYDGNDSIYANLGTDSMWNFSNNSRTVLARYSISGDSWRTLSAPPNASAYVQNNLTSDGHGGLYIFTSDVEGNLSANQMGLRYDIASDTWSEVQGLNSHMYYGSATSDNNRYLYLFPSENGITTKMLRFDTWNQQITPLTQDIDKWERSLWDYPVNAWPWQQGNSTTATSDGSKYLYVLGADEGSFSMFARFDPKTGETNYLPPPYYVNQGGSMAYQGGMIYYMRTGNSRDFYRYDPVSQQWTRMADVGATPYRPGPTALQTVGSNIYALMGNGTGFYMYTPNSGTGTWTQKASAPGTVLNGSAVYDAANGYIYVIAGNSSAAFYRYSIASNSWSTMSALPATSASGSAMTMNNGMIYAALGNSTNTTYVYDPTANSWSNGTAAPDTFRTGALFVPFTNSSALALVGDNSPDLWQFNYPTTSTAYEGSATHISQPMTVAGIYDYANITAQVDIPTNTTAEFYTRSSDDGNTWDNWAITTDVKYYSGQLTARVMSTPRKYTQIKVVLNSADNLYTPTVYSYALNYYYDVDPPSNPSVLNVYKDTTKTGTLASSTWYNDATPVFDWPDPGQPGGATDGPLGSNLAGYWVYVGTDPTASPRTAGTFVTDSQYIPTLTISGTYYVRIQAQDVTGNVDGNIYAPFVYKFDKDVPTTPSLITVTPGGYTTQNKFTFDWPAAFDADSGIAGYCYHTGATSGPFAVETCQQGRNLTDISAAYRTGTNVLYLRTIDNAGNYSSGYTTVSFYYSTDPPSPPTNLRAIPPTSPQNLFAYAWDLPSLYSGDPNQMTYCYSVNELPSDIDSTCTQDRFIAPFKAATRQGTNILYMVAKDEAGNVNWNNYTSANFIANTVSPGIPLNIVVTDTSDRVSGRWALTITWDPPTQVGNGISDYVVQRSPDGHTFADIGKTSTVAYVDLNVVPGSTYYYRIQAEDDVGNRGGPSGTISATPKGSFTAAPAIVVQPDAQSSFNQASIHWVTNRDSSSFVYYGTDPTNLTASKGSLTPTSDHTVALDGLQPSSTYYYRVQSFDDDRTYDLSTSYSNIFYFKTTDAARVYSVASDSTTLNSTVLNWQTSVPTKTRIDYGTTAAYGLTQTDDTATLSSDHVFKLTGLSSGTTYHYRIVATTSFGSSVMSDDYTVSTQARPVVSNVRFSPIEDAPTTGVVVSWDTNVPTSSTVRYTGAGTAQEVSTSELTTTHTTTLSSMASSTNYTFSIEGRDQYGNLVAAEDQHWQSGFDTRPPSISDVSLSMTTTDGVGNTRAQLIVSWKTDEPSTSQVSYGTASSGKLSQTTPLDTEPSTSHVVVISNLNLASIYKVKVISKDISGNAAFGTPTLVVTPDKEVSVLDSVITLMQRLFRF